MLALDVKDETVRAQQHLLLAFNVAFCKSGRRIIGCNTIESICTLEQLNACNVNTVQMYMRTGSVGNTRL